jgi:uncharacterized protein
MSFGGSRSSRGGHAAWGLAAVLLAGSFARGASSPPPPPKHHFDDRAGFVSAADASRLDARLAELERQTGHQVVVAIFPALPEPVMEEFTVKTAQAWRVGQEALDNGVVLFVFAKDRKLRLEVGYGLEDRIPDALAGRIINETIVPRLRAGDAAGALEAGIDAIVAATRGEYRPVAAPPPPVATAPNTIVLTSDDVRGFLALVVGFVTALFVVRERSAGDSKRADGTISGRAFLAVVAALLVTIAALYLAYGFVTRVLLFGSGLGALYLASRPSFARRLVKRPDSPWAPAIRVLASAWLGLFGLALSAWPFLIGETWGGWGLGSVAMFLALDGFSALGAWRAKYWWVKMLFFGWMVILALAFAFSSHDVFGFVPITALPIFWPVFWLFAGMLLAPVLGLFRPRPHEWWMPAGSGGGSGGSSSSGTTWSGSGSSSSGSSFSGGGGGFGGGGASGSW